ncbi:tRNA uridine-5-carboxymethylaminomethyl(34) synthesis GTPase MnmE [Kerstersia sp.]|uniref:tRNA uridine-5-carboxymethylaminomethyl(34) synthesis GTPase MnmE n=1 Tax=Kerstersia sp. TaxID=1930783 RepID=UPI003F8FF754
MSILDAKPIVAIATAPGRAGIGIIRLSGLALGPLVQALLGQDLKPRHAHFLPFRDGDGSTIDEGIAIHFPGPHSYTGEDVLELQGHGGPAVLRRLLQRCLDAGRTHGLRLAAPGEFTQRAFLNGRLDLAQAEAVADLIDASSEAAARSAVASLSGVFSAKVNDLADRITHLRILVEATLDFPEEEIDFLEKYQAAATLTGLRAELADILAKTRQGVALRDGLKVVLAGEPNVGKSSLLNALAGEDIAIVTPIAGTTRDKVTQEIHLDGVPLHIIDTAGLRDTDDLVESLGIERSWNEIANADIVLHLQDARLPVQAISARILGHCRPGVPVLQVFNKIDLAEKETGTAWQLSSAAVTGIAASTSAATEPPESRPNGTRHTLTTIGISAKRGDGLDALRQQLLHLAGWTPGEASPWLARARHVEALNLASAHLEMAALHAAQNDTVLDLFAEELRLAHDALGEITGKVSSDDLLGLIFSSFCIGK